MKVLSIDVGIKNLAFCLFEKLGTDFQIEKWDSINVAEKEEALCQYTSKNIPCNKQAKFTKNDECYCLTHSKKMNYQIPTNELQDSYIKKQKIQTLYEIADKYNIAYEKTIKKAELVSQLKEYIHKTCFDKLNGTKSGEIDLITIGKNIKYKLDLLLDKYDTIEYVVIENQISTIASRMKTIQGMIAQYFIMRFDNVHVEFISPINKLKEFQITKEKTKYSERKKMSIDKCLEMITNDYRFQKQQKYFLSHKKKDDLADSFLQGLWYIQKKLTN
jgi:hypothetical protein